MVKEIPQYPGYFASESGGIYKAEANGNLSEMKYYKLAKGYICVKIKEDGSWKNLYVHRLVASAFLPEGDNTKEIDHIDTNPLNNNVSNLRWATRKENSNNSLSLSNYKVANMKKAQDRFGYEEGMKTYNAPKEGRLSDIIRGFQVGKIYKINHAFASQMRIISTCHNLKKHGYVFQTLNFEDKGYSLVKANAVVVEKKKEESKNVMKLIQRKTNDKPMIQRKKIIQVPPGSVEKMCKAFRCRRTAVYDALAFKTNSELANIIRQNALSTYGGVQTTKLIMS